MGTTRLWIAVAAISAPICYAAARPIQVEAQQPAAKPAAQPAPTAPAAKPPTAAPAAKPPAAAAPATQSPPAAKPSAQPPPAAVAAPKTQPVKSQTEEGATTATPSAAKPSAAKPSPSAKFGPAKSEIETAKKLLDSPDRDKVEEGLKKLAESGKPSIAAPVAARLRRGLPPLLAELAIQALATTKQPLAIPVLVELCGHREVKVRVAAIGALGVLRARSALPSLLDALDDRDPTVRAAAAQALAKIGSRQALKQLYPEFERGDATALSAIAALANQQDVDKLIGYLDQHPFGELQPAFSALLERQDFPISGKQHLIERLGAREDVEAREYLRGLLNTPGKGTGPEIKRAIGKALQPKGEIRAKTAGQAQPQPDAKKVPARKEAK